MPTAAEISVIDTILIAYRDGRNFRGLQEEPLIGRVFYRRARPIIGTGLFCANILVGLASSGYQHGLVAGNFEWMAAFCLILLGMVFAPFYFRSKISTLPVLR